VIVFDLDGTLVDSQAEIADALEHAWAQTVPGRQFPRTRLRIGPPLSDVVQSLDPTLDDARREAVIEGFRARYDASDFAATRPYHGVAEALDVLQARGATLAIATYKRRAPTGKIVSRWFPGRFAHVLCGDGRWPAEDDAELHWHKREMLSWLLRASGRSDGTVVMVGDASSDVAAARDVGVRAIAVAWGYSTAPSLLAAAPDALVSDVSEMLAALGIES
jgi:phosphoglycolate phosphatase